MYIITAWNVRKFVIYTYDLTVFSVDSSYLTGHSVVSLVVVFVLLSVVMVYAVYRNCMKGNGLKGKKMSYEAVDETQALITVHDETERYTVI